MESSLSISTHYWGMALFNAMGKVFDYAILAIYTNEYKGCPSIIRISMILLGRYEPSPISIGICIFLS